MSNAVRSIDLNCDMGESFGAWTMGNDRAVLDHVTSANVACGFHAGDPRIMQQTVADALARGVQIGAHPGFQDLAGFARAAGTRLNHVKAHGALYNMAIKDRALTDAIVRAVRDVDAELIFFGLAGTCMIEAAEAIGLRAAAEVFADRTYQDDGSLTPRTQPGAMIVDEDVSAEQVKRMVLEGRVRSVNGRDVAVRADTLCIHGDQPGAVAFAQRIRAMLAAEGVAVRAPV